MARWIILFFEVVMGRARILLLHLALLALPATAYADSSGEDYRPDPAAVQRYGPAYRFPQAGWTVLHIEGEPYERGYQHGRLMAPEIARYIPELATYRTIRAPRD